MDALRSIAVIVVYGCVPLSIGAAAYCWRLFREDVFFFPGPPLRFTLVFAVTTTMGAIAAFLLAVATTAFLVAVPSLASLGAVALTLAVMILDVIPIVTAVYLRLRRRRLEVPPMAPHGSDGEPLVLQE